jgi:uncharacterized membrane protein
MRVAGASNDFIISLKRPFTLINQKNFFRVRVDNAIIPHTIKQINSNNNKLNYVYTKNSIVTNGSITLTPGNYTILTLLTELQTRLLAVISNVTFNFTYNRNTGYVNFSMSSTDSIASFLTLKFSTNSKLGLFFGIVGDCSFSTPTVAGVTSSQNVNCNPITYLTIRASTLKQYLDFENIVEKDVYSDVLAIVPINVQPGCFILYSNSPNTDLTNKIIDTLNIYIADNQSYSISLGNLDWSLTLIFEEIGVLTPDELINSINAPDTLALENQRDDMMKELMMMKEQLINQLQPLPTLMM